MEVGDVIKVTAKLNDSADFNAMLRDVGQKIAESEGTMKIAYERIHNAFLFARLGEVNELNIRLDPLLKITVREYIALARALFTLGQGATYWSDRCSELADCLFDLDHEIEETR
jgi:hypothetical protein